MDKLQKYKSTDKMIDLISDNYSLLQVMSRFGLSLGFGDKTVKDVCEMNGVDCTTFLAVVNFMEEGFSRLGIIIKYCPAKANTNLLNAALFDIYACEEGLESHCHVEDFLFVRRERQPGIA